MTTDSDLVLGRALIAAAWADGELDEAERESLEDLLLGLDGIEPDTWRALHADLDRPIGEAHRARLLEEFEASLSDDATRERAATLIEQLAARLDPDSAEVQVLRELGAGLTSAGPPLPSGSGPGLLGRLGAALSQSLGTHSSSVRTNAGRERHWEESMRERLDRHWPDSETRPTAPDLHRICTGAAILAHVVRLDGTVDPGEVEALGAALRDQWGLSAAAASLATEIVLDETAGGLDLHLLLREFQRSTTEHERQRFLAAVFTVAAGDGIATYDEIEEVRRIGRGLLLSHQHFIEAKLSVPGRRRDT